MRLRDYVRAIGLGVASALWCIGWLVYDLFIAPMHGWERVVFPLIFGVLLVWVLWQIPRSLRSYRRLRDSSYALGLQRAKMVATMLRRGYPPDVILQVDRMIMGEAPIESVLAVLAEHRPRRHFYN
jgi:hypothetical protein